MTEEYEQRNDVNRRSSQTESRKSVTFSAPAAVQDVV